MELQDAKQLKFGFKTAQRENKMTLLNLLKTSDPELSSKLESSSRGTQAYNWLKNFMSKETKDLPHDSNNESEEESMMSERPPAQSQGAPNSPIDKSLTSPGCMSTMANSQFI